MALANDNIILRAVEPEDLDNLYEWENIPELWSTGNTRQPYSKFTLKNYISQLGSTIYDTGQLRLMMVSKSTGETIGTVDLFDFDMHHSRVAVGLFVAPPFQGKGYAQSTLELVEDYVFDFLKIKQLYCFVAISNKASVQVFSNRNFIRTKLKAWINTNAGYEDVYVFQKFSGN